VIPFIVSPLCPVSRRPIWAGTRSDNLLVGPGTPRGRNADKYLHKKFDAQNHMKHIYAKENAIPVQHKGRRLQ
jgi:hypothetical protein